MINKEKFKWIAVFTALILLFAGVISSLAIAIGNKPTDKQENISAATEDNPMVLLTMGEATIVQAVPEVSKVDSSESVYVSQTVTATINPSTVVDKYVTWSVAWATDAPLKNSDISEYIKVTDES